MAKSLFGDLLKQEDFYKASTIVEDLSEKVPQRAPFFSTSPTMSWGSAAGYFPGMMELMYGPKSSGKTMIVLDRIKHALKEDPECIAVFVDAEMSFEYETTLKWMRANGVDLERVMVIRDVCIKEIFEKHLLNTVQKAIKNDGVKVAYIAMDSIQAMSVQNVPSTDKQMDKAELTKQDYGARANYLSRIFPFYRRFCRDHRVFTTFIGQARDGGKDRFGNTRWATNGGEALFHEVQYRTLVTPCGEPIFSSDKDAQGNEVKIGHRIKFKFEKNKAGEGQDRVGHCDIVYMKGIVNVEEELIELASKLNIIESKGAWLYYDKHKCNGKKQMAKVLEDDELLYQEIFAKVMSRASTEV